MVTIKVGASRCKILGDIDDEKFESIRFNLSYEDRNADQVRRQFYARGQGRQAQFVPDRKYLLTPKRRDFRTGLLPRVKQQLEFQGLEYEVHDERVEAPPDHPMMIRQEIEFRDYQWEAADVGIREKNGIIRMATGSGKTRCMALIASLLERRTVILVHRRDLMQQVLDVFRELLQWPELIGQVGGGVYEPNIITVCTIQTICAALGINDETEDRDRENVAGAKSHAEEIREMLDCAQVVINDEVHHCPARTVAAVLELCENATWKIGMSATDWRDDGADLLIEAGIGPRIYDVSLSDLIDMGYLVPAHITMQPMAYEGVDPDTDNYNSLMRAYYTDNKHFHQQVLAQNADWHNAGGHILTLVTLVKHGRILEEMHRKFGIPTKFIEGSTPSHQREEIFRDVRSGELRCLIGTSIADEGLDLPILDRLNLAGGGKSSTKTYQRIGRVLRKYGDKKCALVADYRYRRNKKLNKHANRRQAAYTTERGFVYVEEK